MACEETLIENVRKYPCLYAINDSAYHDKIAKRNAWREVAKNCGCEVEDAKKIWKLLRDNYTRAKRRAGQKKSGDGGGTSIEFKHSVLLSFLNDFLKPRPTTSNFHNKESEMNDCESQLDDSHISVSQKENSTISRKRRPSKPADEFEDRVLRLLENPLDEDELFCKAITSTLKRFKPEVKARAKVKVQELLYKMEFLDESDVDVFERFL